MLFSLYLLLSLAAHADQPREEFYSPKGREYEVRFDANFLTGLNSVSEVETLSKNERENLIRYEIEPTLKFLFGPGTNRGIGNPQRGLQVSVDWNSAKMHGGRVLLRYRYSAKWILNREVKDGFTLPLPLNAADLTTAKWKYCTDSDPEHQTPDFYWYFWDPERPGCDHREGEQYETVTISLGAQTKNQSETRPEYSNLLRRSGAINSLNLTFAFGYVEDPRDPNPDRDGDQGMQAYRSFLGKVRQQRGLQESPVRQGEYKGAWSANKIIGHRFTGTLRGVDVKITVVTAAGIDQMELFAKSFAHDHDGFFAWMGHSRVGSGFDAERFARMVKNDPSYYSISSQYQLVYWGGCNSYSYYTLPFFELKAAASGGRDPNGTKGLDIIANGMPSYFSLNGINAQIMLKHLLGWEKQASYQTILDEIEAAAGNYGTEVLVSVLGDEDN
jgi:hypothetical protein